MRRELSGETPLDFFSDRLPRRQSALFAACIPLAQFEKVDFQKSISLERKELVLFNRLRNGFSKEHSLWSWAGEIENSLLRKGVHP